MTRARTLSLLGNENNFTVTNTSPNRVGVGSTQPDAKLDVGGDVVVGTAITLGNVSGIVSATDFYVDGVSITGAAGTWATFTSGGEGGISTTKKVKIENSLEVTGVSTFSGNLTVGGVLSYADVTNVDSVGIVTARSGIEFGVSGVGGTITALGHGGFTGIVTALGFQATGVVTAASFRGDGSQLSGVDSSNLVDSGDTNRVAANTSGVVVTGIATITGSAKISSNEAITLDNNAHTGETLFLRSGGTAGAGNTQALLAFGKADSSSLRTGSALGSIQTDSDTDRIGLAFYTSPGSSSSQTLQEKLRITHDGNVLVAKTTTALTTAGARLGNGLITVSGDSNSTNLATNSGGNLSLANVDSTDNNFSNIGGYNSNGLVVNQIDFINKSHSSRTGDIAFLTHNGTNLTEKLRIASNGSVGFNTTLTSGAITVNIAGDYKSVTQNVADEGIIFQSFTTASTGDVYPGISWTGNPTALGRARAAITAIAVNDNNGSDLVFLARNQADGTELDVTDDEKVRITASGRVGIGSDNPQEELDLLNDTNGNVTLRVQNTNSGNAARSNVSIHSDGAVLDMYATSSAYNGVASWTDSGVLSTSSDTSGGLKLNAQSGGVTIQTGTTTRLEVQNGGNVLPGGDNSQDLGSTSARWANIYSADLQLSNEGMGNDVDGTWGQYTIQEGENDLFLLNRRNGKKYRFMLEEV